MELIMSYQIGFFSCINPAMSWLPGDPSEPRCEYSGQVWYFAANEYGKRLSGYYRSEGEVHAAMGSTPTFNMESLQLTKKAEYLQNQDAVWASQDAYNNELLETQGEITAYNESLKTQTTTTDKPKFNIWFIVLPIVIFVGYLIFGRRK